MGKPLELVQFAVRFAGGAATTDPVLVDRYCRIHRQVWTLAIPHRDYVTAS
jgi:hypothetical protein